MSGYSNRLGVGLASAVVVCAVGCYAPLRSPGTPASRLPDHFRTPVKSCSAPLNFGQLSMSVPDEYLLGRDDVLKVEIYDLFANRNQPRQITGIQGPTRDEFEVRVSGRGNVLLPLVGEVLVGGMSLAQAQNAIVGAYMDKQFINTPRITVSVLEKSTTSVMVWAK